MGRLISASFSPVALSSQRSKAEPDGRRVPYSAFRNTDDVIFAGKRLSSAQPTLMSPKSAPNSPLSPKSPIPL